jgi:glycine dehydrogenase subunit 1
MHRYISLTEADRIEMCERIGIKNPTELFEQIPESLRLSLPLNLPPALSEMELMRRMRAVAQENTNAVAYPSFLGGGAYRHYTPAFISQILSRPEFRTAYTSYHGEAAQGTLQALYEFETYTSILSGMDVANASLYDGATAAAEAVLMARRVNKKGSAAVISRALHPHYREVIRTYLKDIGIEVRELPIGKESGETLFNLELMKDAFCLVVGYPNYFGVAADLASARAAADSAGALLVSVTTEPLALALLKSPGEYGVDIFAGEGQSFGIPPSFGGPYLGLFGIKYPEWMKEEREKEKYLRQMPGRIVGAGKELEGKDGYAIVLSTREQHIRRGAATSNICSNETLCAIAAAMFLSVHGKEGLKNLAMLNLEKAFRLKRKIAALPNFSIPYPGYTFNEFVVRAQTLPAKEVLLKLEEEHHILGGIDVGEKYPEYPNDFLVSVTEENSDEETECFLRALTEVSK